MNKILLRLMCSLGLMSDEKSINVDELEDIRGVFYEINKENPYTGKVNIYYESGEIKIKGNYENGVMNGESIIYYESGQVKSRQNYKDGLENGEAILYWGDGNIKLKGN